MQRLCTHRTLSLRLRQLPNSSLVQLRRLQCHALDAWHGRQLQRELLALLRGRRLLPTPLLRRMTMFPSLQGLLVVGLRLSCRLLRPCQQLQVLVCGLPATLKPRICHGRRLLCRVLEWAQLVSSHLLQSLRLLLCKERAGSPQLGPQRIAQLHQAFVFVLEARNLHSSLLQLLYSILLRACLLLLLLLLLLLAVCTVLHLARQPLSACMLPLPAPCCNSSMLLMPWPIGHVGRPCRLRPGGLLLLLLMMQHLHLRSHGCQRAAQTSVLLPFLPQGGLHSYTLSLERES